MLQTIVFLTFHLNLCCDCINSKFFFAFITPFSTDVFMLPYFLKYVYLVMELLLYKEQI